MKKFVIGTLIVGGLGVFAYGIYNYFIKQANLLKQFDWKILTFSIDTLSLELVKGTITFRFTSISDIEFTIESFYLDFYVNGQKAGYITDITQFVIPARGYSDIPFEFTIDPQLIITDITDIIAYATKSKDAIITLDGYVQLSSGFVKATVPIKCNCSLTKMDCSC